MMMMMSLNRSNKRVSDMHVRCITRALITISKHSHLGLLSVVLQTWRGLYKNAQHSMYTREGQTNECLIDG